MIAPYSLPLTHDLADWIVSKHSQNSPQAQVHYHLGGRIFLAGAALFSMTEAVSRVGLGILATVVYGASLRHWQTAKDFGMKQLQQGTLAGRVALSCLRSLISPKNFVPSPIPLWNEPPTSEAFNAEERTHRIIEDPMTISRKLQTELVFAKNQFKEEKDRSFIYLSAPLDFEGSTELLTVSHYQVGLCHFIGRRNAMEDEHLATVFRLRINHEMHSIPLFGIFDGHGSKKASQYVQKELTSTLFLTLKEFCPKKLSRTNIWNALKHTFVKLHEEFNEDRSGTTATVAMLLDGWLWTANVGDSRTLLSNGIPLSEDAYPSNSRYERGINKRGGIVFFSRLNGCLAMARAVGDHDEGQVVNPRPKITRYCLSQIPKDTLLILACDGIFEAASSKEVAEAASKHREIPPDKLARNLVYSAWKGGSKDNCSALIVKL